ncbi:MAG: MBG domain-containing protein [Alphaproteobacteria bacterium]|nr:MBG domain-containing protein [Alphaproteobacteria bacterium]
MSHPFLPVCHRSPGQRQKIRPGRTGITLALGLMLGGAAHAAAPASNALPTGGQIVSGSGSISQTASSLTVNQSSDKLVANWSSFDIGSNASVNFVQPSATSVALNRISGGASQIFGHLTANGKVILVNPNGIIFGAGSRVDVGGLVASSLDMSDADFAAGNNHFAGSGTGPIVNNGTITVPAGSVVAMIAPQVSNNGTINASGGGVALAAGQDVTLDFTGDNLVSVTVSRAAFDALVENKGIIVADGGVAIMSAQSANALLETVVNNDGIVQANSLSDKNGRIILDGGDSGTVAVSGTLQADGTQAGQSGGTITATGNQVNVAATVVIDASGNAGGGTIKIGGGVRGQDASIANAKDVTVAAGAQIKANATDNGNGGTVTVWSDGKTDVSGAMQAKGGPNGGDGGYVETSGASLTLEKYLFVNTGAAKGSGGLWLLDPTTETYQTIGGTEASAIETALASGEVNDVTSGGIHITSSIVSGAGNKLTFQSANQILVDAVTVSTGGGALYFGGEAGGTSYATGAASGQAGVVLNGSTLNAGAGLLTIRGQGYTPGLLTGTGSLSANESAGIGVDFQGTVSLTGGTINVTGVGGTGQAVENTTATGPLVTGTGYFWSTNTHVGGNNGASASAGDGAVGVDVESGASVTVTGSTAATINATGGDGGDASIDNLGGSGSWGGNGAIGYYQQGAVAFNTPTATISASRGYSGYGSSPGYYVDEAVGPQCNGDCNYDAYDSGNGLYDAYGGGTEEYGTTPQISYNDGSGSDASYALYINGNLSNTNGVGSILNIEGNYDAYQNSGALTASHVMMEGLDSENPVFNFSQANNAIDMLASQSVGTLYFNDKDSGTQSLHIGTVSGVAGVNTASETNIQVQGGNGASASLIVDNGAGVAAGTYGTLTANTILFNSGDSSISGTYFAVRPYSTSQNFVMAAADPNAGGDLYIPVGNISKFNSSSLTFGDSADTGNVTVSSNADFGSTNMAFLTGSGGITLSGNITTTGNMALRSGGTVNATGALTVNTLGLDGAGGVFNLDNSANVVSNLLTTDSVGTVDFLDNHALNISDTYLNEGANAWNNPPDDNVGFAGVHASNRVYINAAGNVTIASGDTVTAQGSYTGSATYSSPANKNVQEAASVVLVSGGIFTNNEGSDAISTAASNRFLVYASAPKNNTSGSGSGENMSYDFKMYAFDFYNSGHTGNGNNGFDYDNGGFGRSLPASTVGSGFIYSSQPTLTVTPKAQSGTYGNSPSLSTVYNTGYQLGGFVDGDSQSNDTGTPAFTTTATSASAVGTYDISYTAATAGDATHGLVPKYNGVVMGYSVVNSTRANGYTVGQRPITVTATGGQSMVYGDSVPTLAYTVSSGTLVNTGTSGNGSLSGNLATNATSASNVGNGYNITQGTLANANYLITYNGTTFSITKRPVTITATADQSKIVGTADPVFTYSPSYTGNGGKPALVNGNTFTGLLTRDSGELVGSYNINQGSLAISDGNSGNNYQITYVTNPFKVNPIISVPATDPQTGVNGTGSTVAADTAANNVGPGTGSGTITTNANTQLVSDNQTHAPATGGMTLTSGGGTGPVSVTQSGPTVTFTFPAGATVPPVPPAAQSGLPLFVAGSGQGTTYSLTQKGSALSATTVGAATTPQPTNTVFASTPAQASLTQSDGSSLTISVGISSTGVLVVEVPAGSISTLDPQTTMLLAWTVASQNFGANVGSITSVVITPAKES